MSLRVNHLVGFGARRASGGGGGGPTFANVKLLVGFDGSDAATSATDESPDARTLTFVGNAQLDTAAFKFGTASLLLDGSGDCVTAVDSDDFTFDGEFTVEAWARPNFSSITSGAVVSHTDNLAASTEGWSLRFAYTGATTKYVEFVFMGVGGTSGDRITLTSATSNIDQSVFHHFAADRDAAGKMRLYLDGVMVASQTGTGAGQNASTLLRIGAETSFSSAQRQWNGWIDEVRITKGEAIYASDSGFTPPTAAFPRS